MAKELLGLALALALVGVFSMFGGGFWWMAGIILASEVLWLAVRSIRYLMTRNTATN